MPLEAVTVSDKNLYDIAIIGTGPAGLSTAVYARLANLKVVCIEQAVPGGKLASIKNINNFLGYKSISGPDLALSFFDHATFLGAEIIYNKVDYISEKLGYYLVTCANNFTLLAKTIVIASGVENIKLNIINEKKYFQKGVSYCVSCDCALTKNKICAVVGNFKDAIFLSNTAKKVYFLGKQENNKISNIEIINSKIKSIDGNGQHIETITLENGKVLSVSFVFIEIGSIPANDFIDFKEIIDTDGTIINDENKATSIKGVFAVGDISRKNNRQICTAVADGAIVVNSVLKYINNKLL
jgi:thioredoxin reductase (NADPH)